SIDAGRIRIRLADGLLGLTIRLRAYAVQLALLLATNLGAGAVAFGAVPRRNPPALRNHAFVDPLLDLTDVVNALDPHIDELDAQIGHVLPPLFDHQRGQGIAPQALLRGHILHRGWHRGVRLHFRRHTLFLWGPSLLQRLRRQLAGKRADSLDQQVATDDIAGRGVDEITQATLRRALLAPGLQKAQRVGDAPARRGIQDDKPLILRRDLSWQSVPFQDTLVEAMNGLHKWYLD